jgi:hypothetical protein
MSVITEHIGTARTHRPAVGTLRLRLKSAHRSCGFVQGGWWPQSTGLVAELPALLNALSLRFGAIDRLRYHQRDWSPTPPSIEHQGSRVMLDASHDSPNVITVFGKDLGRLALLVVPPYTDAGDAYAAMSAAASVGNASTPNRLLEFSARSAEDHHHAPIELQRRGCAIGV